MRNLAFQESIQHSRLFNISTVASLVRVVCINGCKNKTTPLLAELHDSDYYSLPFSNCDFEREISFKRFVARPKMAGKLLYIILDVDLISGFCRAKSADGISW